MSAPELVGFVPGMPLNVISSLPLLQEFLVKRAHRGVMLRKLINTNRFSMVTV